MQGHIDAVTPEGLVEGWCRDETDDSARPAVRFLVNGIAAGEANAGLYRDDLKRAGLGDGHYGFSGHVDCDAFTSRRVQSVQMVDAASGQPIGPPFVLRLPEAESFDERLSVLETRNRLLAARLAELEAERRPLPATSLPPLDFARAKAVSFTVLVAANVPLGPLHACLTALKRAGVEQGGRVTVLDEGRFADNALLPGLMRGIGYIRCAGARCAEWRRALTEAEGAVLVLLDGDGLLQPGALAALLRALAAGETLGAAGAHRLGPGGEILAGGLSLDHGLFTDSARGDLPAGVDPGLPHDVHALATGAVALRRKALAEVGGLDPAFGDALDLALADLCLRLRARGWGVVLQPKAGFVGGTQPAPPDLAALGPEAERLRRHLPPEAERMPRGLALVWGGSRLADDVEAIRRLRRARFHVVYRAADAAARERLAPLAEGGVPVLTETPPGLRWALLFRVEAPGRVSVAPRAALVVTGLDALAKVLEAAS